MASTPIQNTPYSILTSNGTHHSCYYDLIIPFPVNVLNILHAETGNGISGPELIDRLNYYCISVFVPQCSIMTSPIRIGGETIEVPYDKVYNEFTAQFYLDGGYQGNGGVCYNAFQAWLDTIYPPITRNFAYPSEYRTNIKLALYTTPDPRYPQRKQEIVTVNILDAYPTSVNAVQLTGTSGSQATQFDVNFKYRYILPGDLNTKPEKKTEVLQTVQNGFQLARSLGTTTNSNQIIQQVASGSNPFKTTRSDWI